MKNIITIIALCIFSVMAKAQIPQPDPDTTAKHFLTVASISNLQEVSAGQLAVQKAKLADVKSFGQMMVNEHGMAEQELLTLTKRKRIELPAAAIAEVQPDPMLKSAGDNFDKLYVHAMVTGHNNTVQSFENYATTGKDPDVKAFAQKMLPSLKMHLEHIKAIEKQLK